MACSDVDSMFSFSLFTSDAPVPASGNSYCMLILHFLANQPLRESLRESFDKLASKLNRR